MGCSVSDLKSERGKKKKKWIRCDTLSSAGVSTWSVAGWCWWSVAGGRRWLWWWWSHVWLQSYGLGGPFYGNWVHTSLLRSDRNTTKCCSRGNSLISSAAPSWIMDRLGLIVFCTVPISHVYSYPRARNYKMCQCIWLTRLLPTLPSDGTHGLIVVLQDDEEGGMLKSSTVRLHYSNLKVHRIPISFSTVR